MRALAALALLLATAEPARPEVELKVVTSGGYIAFRVEADWPVVATRSQPPLSLFVFQLPNPADEGTPDSTNLAVSVFQLDSEEGKAAFARPPIATGSEPKRERIEDWEVLRREGTQGGTTYAILDARRAFRHGGVAIRLAWPRLAANAPDYEAGIERTLRALLASVREHVGPPE
jgi:hypothetical protein